MGIKKWESVLELNKPKSKLNDDDRVNLITQHIEKLSLDNCYYKPSQKKDCACLSFFQDGLMQFSLLNGALKENGEGVWMPLGNNNTGKGV